MVQLVRAFYFVPFRSGGGKRWPDVARAVAPLHVDRFQPLLGLHGAVGFNFYRACGAETVVQLVRAFYFVPFRSGGFVQVLPPLALQGRERQAASS